MMITHVGIDTRVVVMVNGASVPLGLVRLTGCVKTVAGTEATAGLLLVSPMVCCSATVVSDRCVAVADACCPLTMLAGTDNVTRTGKLGDVAIGVGGLTNIIVRVRLFPSVAKTDAHPPIPDAVATTNAPEALPAGTRTVAGTRTSDGMVELSETSTALGTVALSVTVPLALPPWSTWLGLSETDVTPGCRSPRTRNGSAAAPVATRVRIG